MDNLEDMKVMWQQLSARMSSLEEENRRLAKFVRSSDYRSAQEKLVRKYMKFIIVESVMMLWTCLFFVFNPEIVEKYRVLTAIYWGGFFLLEIIFDTYLMMRVKEINVYDSNIDEITHQAAKTWKLHKIFIMIGLPIAIGAAFLFALALDANEFTIAGMVVGGTIGLIIGIRQLMKFLQYYRVLQGKEK